MDELWALQQQLAALQNVSTSNRLSERIIVDLVDKLIREYDLKVIHTSDGQTLMTPAYLSQMIHEAIKKNGRLQISSLPDKMGVGIEKLQVIVDRDSSNWPGIVKVQDELMSEGYIQQMCEEINESLQQKQEIMLSEIVHQYNLPMNFIKNNILVEGSERMGIIQGVISGDKLTTNYYIDIIKSKLRGILRSCIKPMSIQYISKEYQFDEDTANQVIDYLIKSNQIDGKLYQGQFIPTRFLENQENIAKRFFLQNNYVEYELLQKQLCVQKPKEFLKNLFKENFIPLEQCGFNRQALTALKDQITELLVSEGYTDLSVILPPALNKTDIQTLLYKYMEIEEVELSNSLIFSIAHLENLTDKLKPKMVEMIYKQPQKLLQKSEEEEVSPAKKKSKKAPSKNSSQVGKDEIFSEEQVFDFLVGIKAIERDDTSSEQTFIPPHQQRLYQLLIPRIQKLYDTVKIDLFENKKSAANELVQELQKRIEEVFLSLIISTRSIESIQLTYSQSDVRLLIDNCLYGYRLLIENIVVLICKKQLQNFIDSFNLPQIRYQNEDTFNNGAKQSTNNQNAIFIDCAMHKISKIFKNKVSLFQALEILPKDYSKILKDLMTLCLNKQFTELNKNFTSNQEKLGIKVVVDKKSEKNFFQFVKYSNKEEIKSSNTSPDVAFYRLVAVVLADKLSIYFVGNYDEKFNTILTLLLHEAVNNFVKSENEPVQSKKNQKDIIVSPINDVKQVLSLLEQIMSKLATKDQSVNENVKELVKVIKL